MRGWPLRVVVEFAIEAGLVFCSTAADADKESSLPTIVLDEASDADVGARLSVLSTVDFGGSTGRSSRRCVCEEEAAKSLLV
jgi:hypothetical protein